MKFQFNCTALLLILCVLMGCKQESPDADVPLINEVLTPSAPRDEPKANLENENFEELVSVYEDVERQNWQKPRLVVQSLGDLSDKVVADIGSGTGYFTLRFLPLAKKVIAVDIDQRMIDFIDKLKLELDDRFSQKLETRLATASNPNLKPQEVDLIFMSNTYAYLEDRVAYCKQLKKMLKPGGRVVIVDFKKKILPIFPNQENRIPLFQVEQELIDAGFRIVKSDDMSLPYQYIIEVK